MFGKMKHSVEIKMPKFLTGEGAEMTEEEKKQAKRAALIGGGMLLGTTIIYLMGYNRGLKKASGSNGRSNIYVIKQ